MQNLLSRNEAIARAYYVEHGFLPYDMIVKLVNDGFVVPELEKLWDEERANGVAQ